MTLYDRLLPLRDEGYRAFQVKLVPNIPAQTVIGVRTPALRALAKTLSPAEAEAFGRSLPHRYFEENLVHFFLLARIKDFDACVQAVDAFLPYVDCWPVSDQATPAVFRKNHEKLLPWVRRWLASSHVYTARFALRMLMNEYLDGDFTPEYPALAAAKIGEEYYLNMMVAWYFATALAKRYDDVLPYLEGRALGEWVHKKTIQKAVESYRVTDEHKAYLKTLR